MSRPKSEKTLALERDRAIRRERRELKRKAREARRAKREMKRRVREGIAQNGVPKVERTISVHDALSHNPCDSCHRIVGNIDIIQRFCRTCCYSENREEVVARIHKENSLIETSAKPGEVVDDPPMPPQTGTQLMLRLMRIGGER